MSDRNEFTNPAPELRLLGGLLKLVSVILAIVTMFTILWFGISTFVSPATVTLQGYTEEAIVEHTHVDGSVVRHDLESGQTSFASFGEDLDETVGLSNGIEGFSRVEVSMSVEDATVRAIVIVTFAFWIALAWVGIVNMRRFVYATGRGMFTPNTARPLAFAGFAAIAYALSQLAYHVAVNAALGSSESFVNGFRVDAIDAGDWIWVALGLFLLVMSRAFAWGIELRDLEEQTV